MGPLHIQCLHIKYHSSQVNKHKTDSTTQIICESQQSRVTTRIEVLKKLTAGQDISQLQSKWKFDYHIHKNSGPQQIESSPHPWIMFP
jgi:hypothetical protein